VSHRFWHAALLGFLIALLCSESSVAGVAEGLEALGKGDYATATKELRPLADRGNSEAQYRVGMMYEFGKGYPADKKQAMAWYRKSAAQGNASAELVLGVIYATGDGVPQDDAQAVGWLQKAAAHGDPTAQYNLALMYAKGRGVKEDDAQAIAWFRKSADQGYLGAQFKLGVAYEYGEGVAKDNVLAYANYAIAARDGNEEYAAHRDGIARQLAPPQLREAQALADAWQPGQPMPTRIAANKDQPSAKAAASGRAQTCSATGLMEGEKYTAKNCAVALYGDQHSVAIWFNEDPISPEEAESFQLSSYASDSKAGKQRTMVRIMFCPGGGSTSASPAAVKSIDLNTNHAKAGVPGIQWVVESPKDFKVDKMAGDIKPGGALTGKIVGARGKTTWNLDLDVTLPAKDAAAGLSCTR
jgi:uncharacterized protein